MSGRARTRGSRRSGRHAGTVDFVRALREMDSRVAAARTLQHNAGPLAAVDANPLLPAVAADNDANPLPAVAADNATNPLLPALGANNAAPLPAVAADNAALGPNPADLLLPALGPNANPAAGVVPPLVGLADGSVVGAGGGPELPAAEAPVLPASGAVV